MSVTPPPYKGLREAIGLSQRQVERDLGWFDGHRGRLSQIERGLIPTPDERSQLLDYFNRKAQEASRG